MDFDEEWKQIPGYTCYEISNEGEVRRTTATNKNVAGFICKPTIGSDGRLRITLYEAGKQTQKCVHQLVMLAFKGTTPPGMEIRHLDGDYSNNRPDNLAFGTHKQNGADLATHGKLKGVNHPNASMTEASVVRIRELFAKGTSINQLARDLIKVLQL